eukprot:4923200-Prymnesium_polylepis.2
MPSDTCSPPVRVEAMRLGDGGDHTATDTATPAGEVHLVVDGAPHSRRLLIDDPLEQRLVVHFASRPQWQRVAQQPLARAEGGGQLGHERHLDLIGAHTVPRPRRRDAHQLIAHFLDGHIEEWWASEQRDRLHLAQLHPHASYLNLPIGAPVVAQPALLIDTAEIAGAVQQPGRVWVGQEALGCQLRPVQVAVRHLHASDANLADLAR